jgi:acyl-CoA reductase-like NAD-dependent aldehyde dehydrogenase
MPETVAYQMDLLPEVKRFLSQDRILPFIGGRYLAPRHGASFKTVDPGSGQVLAEVASCGAEEVEQAVSAAEKAFADAAWADLPVNERATYLHRLADLVDKKKSEIAQLEALDCGKVLNQALWDVSNFCQTVRYYADLSVHAKRNSPIAVAGHEAWTRRRPYGVCAFIFPWNFPFLLLGWGIAPALAAGNTIVVKPAEDTPLSALFFGQLVQEVGIPAGVVNVIPGLGPEAGAALAGHPRIKRMSFTGSPEVGKLVGAACGGNLVPVKLELGGKGGAVVFEDVDIEETSDKLVGAITLHTGQVCCTASRWIVQKKIYDQFVSSCAEKLQKIQIGHELAANTQMGPVVSAKQRDRVLTYLNRGQQEGAKLVLEGGAEAVRGHERGFYVKPALLAGPSDNVAVREEIFGPVAYLLPFESQEEAIRLVNGTAYGLANSVWTKDLRRAATVAESMVAGNSWINAHNVFVHGVPYGGINLSGLGGGVLGPDTYFDYLRQQSIVRPL